MCVDHLLRAYLTARELIVARGYAWEIDWQDRQRLDSVSERDFLQEAAWVILCAGMRESTIRAKFGAISLAFFDWSSATAIVQERSTCIHAALRVFRHPQKLGAIADVASQVASLGFGPFRQSLTAEGLSRLDTLPYIGPVTRFHLAKNIGIDVVKPDRHLCRMADFAGFADPHAMCRLVADATGDRLSTV